MTAHWIFELNVEEADLSWYQFSCKSAERTKYKDSTELNNMVHTSWKLKKKKKISRVTRLRVFLHLALVKKYLLYHSLLAYAELVY